MSDFPHRTRKRTCPPATATTGVPIGAAMSIPVCFIRVLNCGCFRIPNSLFTLPLTGHGKAPPCIRGFLALNAWPHLPLLFYDASDLAFQLPLGPLQFLHRRGVELLFPLDLFKVAVAFVQGPPMDGPLPFDLPLLLREAFGLYSQVPSRPSLAADPVVLAAVSPVLVRDPG